MQKPRVVIAEGTGAAGMALTRLLVARGYRVTVLSLRPATSAGPVEQVAWDGATPGRWCESLEGAYGLVNLVGTAPYQGAGECLSAALALTEGLVACPDRPAVWLQAGSLNFYGDAERSRPADECAPAGTDADADAWRAIEETVTLAPLATTRRAVYRLGLVLGDDAHAHDRIMRLARWARLCPTAANHAWLSWIHAGDLARLLYWGLRMEIIAGPYNACVPDAARLSEVCRFAGAVSAPVAPCWQEDAVRPEPLVRAMPRRFLDIAYQFRNEDLAQAVGRMETVQAPRERSVEAALR